MARKEGKKKRVWLRAILITLGVLIVACSGVLLKAYLDVKDMTDAVYVSVSKENKRAEDGGSEFYRFDWAKGAIFRAALWERIPED